MTRLFFLNYTMRQLGEKNCGDEGKRKDES